MDGWSIGVNIYSNTPLLQYHKFDNRNINKVDYEMV